MKIGCRDECGAVADDYPTPPGDWRYLEASKAWRCAACARALRDVVGVSTVASVDTLPPDSRGALPKETASTITPPTVPR